MPLWIILITISVVTLSIATLLERALLKDNNSDPITYTLAFQFLYTGIVIILALLTHNLKFYVPNILTFVAALSAGILWAGFSILSFKAFKFVDAGSVTIISSLGAIITAVLAILIYHNVLTLELVIGTILILLAIFILNYSRHSKKTKNGLFYAFLATLFSGVAVIADAYALKSYSIFTYVPISASITAFIIFIVFHKKIKPAIRLIHSKTAIKILAFTIFFIIQAYTYDTSYIVGGPISHIAIISRFYIVLTAILAFIFLGERENIKKKIIASILATIGVILLG